MNLHELIAQGEHQQQDFKYMISSVPKIARSISAFANCEGGRLLVGVRDNGKIAGVRSEEEIYMIDAASQTYCQPAIECMMETVREEGHTVLIATIPPSDIRPVRAIDEDKQLRAYIRVDDENIIASPIHLEMWRQEQETQGELQPFSERESHYINIINEAGEEGITLNKFCKKAQIQRHRAIRLLARWIRFEIIDLVLDEHTWVIVSMAKQ